MATVQTSIERSAAGIIKRLLMLAIPMLLIFNLLPLKYDFPDLSLQEWIAPSTATDDGRSSTAPTTMPTKQEANETSPATTPTAIAPTTHEQVNDSSSTAVFAFMTEPRCLAAVPFVLQNALDKLPPSFPVVLFHSTHNAKCVEQWLKETPVLAQAHQSGRLILELEGHMNPSSAKLIYLPTNWNNVLFTNVTFWESLYKYGNTALTIQADTLICADVGGDGGENGQQSSPYRYTPPWHKNFLGGISWVDNVAPSNATNTYHLNGGLSIRKLDWVISCLREKQSDNITTPEDDIFCNCTGGVDSVSVVDAMAFASDNGHTKCFDWEGRRQCPWGVHKPWARGGANYRELVSYCPDITQLKKLLLT